MRHICYISGTRADFGLMASALSKIDKADDLKLSIIATGMHLSPRYGNSIEEMEACGLNVAAKIVTQLEPATGTTMALGISTMLAGITLELEKMRPDIVLLLGDRGEMIAGALAALHLKIPCAHIHGGERSGTVDEPIRHAISKLSHIHLVATEKSRDRLVAMGEDPEQVHVTGAPGIDGLKDLVSATGAEIYDKWGFDPSRPLALLVFHPAHHDAGVGCAETGIILEALKENDFQTVAVMPNSDAGSAGVRAALQNAEDEGGADFCLKTNLPRSEFVTLMSVADVMIGNSSAGIIEAASFATPVINIGCRQNLRERNSNIVDIDCKPDAIAAALINALKAGRGKSGNIYGDGHAGERIVDILRNTPLNSRLLEKVNRY